ncbi:MAG: DUF11 domain-containing protein [Clostridia bacterium]|nr:DUF11 domain-containing protein [Clostridia bacterium]
MATQINNSATAVYGYGRSSRDSASSNVATTNLITEYAISGYKESLNSTFRAGENITYYIHISNDGTSPLYNVTVSDNLGGTGSPLTFIDSSAVLNINGTNTTIIPTSVNPLTFVLPTPLSAGDLATLTYIARVNSGISETITEITNAATIQANEGSSTGQIIQVTPTPSVTIPLEDYADVSMTKSVSTNEITVGETFSYTITLSNSGNLDATGVVITDVLPANFVISSITTLTNGVLTTFETGDYTLDPTTNTLTLPNTSSALTITVPASTTTGDGTTIVTITGSITA